MSASGSSIIVSWKAIPYEGRSGIILGYNVYYNEIFKNGSLGSTKMEIINGWNIFHHELTDLSFDGTYNISVAGFTSIGAGVRSGVIRGETGDYGKSIYIYMYKFILKTLYIL